MRNAGLDQVRKWFLTALGFLFIAYFFVERFPGAYNALSPGLDPSWMYGLNYLNHTNHIFGRDVVFTYGPLGYLLDAVNIQSNLIQALAFRLLIHAVIIAVLIYYLVWRQRVLPVILFIVVYWIGSNIGIGFSEDEYEYSFIGATCLLTCFSFLENSKAGVAADIFNGFLAGLFLFMKLTLGITAVSIIAVSSLVKWIRKDPSAWKRVYVTAATYGLTVIVVGLAYLKSPLNMILWLKRSADIMEGFSSAMSIIGSSDFLTQALIALAVYLGLLVYLLIRKTPSLDIALALVPAVLLSFRHGFTRQDGHMLLFFSFLIISIGIVMLNGRDLRELKTCGIAVALVIGLTIPVANKFGILSSGKIQEKISAAQGLRNIHLFTNLAATRAELDRQSSSNLEPDRLPEEWLNLIKANNGTVGSIPWDLGYCAINKLDCVPFPTLQMYHAYNTSLDEWSADEYRGNHAPGFLLMDFVDIDGRNMLLDSPATWRSIIQNYEIVKANSRGLQLLKKRDRSGKEQLSETGRTTIENHQWVTVPHSDGLIYAFIEMKLTALGWMSKEAFRIPPVHLGVLLENGTVRQYRIIPATARDGLMVNFIPDNMEQLTRIFSHSSLDRVAKIRIGGPGAEYFENVSQLIWKEDRGYPMPSNPAVRISLDGIRASAEQTDAAIDGLNAYGFPLPAELIANSSTDDSIEVRGWAVDKKAQGTAAAVFVTVDDRMEIPASYGRERPDVSAYLKNSAYLSCGFNATILMDDLSKGSHAISLKILAKNGSEYYTLPQKITVEVR